MRGVKLVAFDCDGVLTDNTYIYDNEGNRLRRYNTSDGVACSLFKKKEILTCTLTSGVESSIRFRAEDMGADLCCIDIQDKLHLLSMICLKYSIDLGAQVAYIGNDIKDKEILEAVKYPFCPVDAEIEILLIEGITILKKNGGAGVLRETYRALFP